MLPNYTDILVATDLSPNSLQAFKHAVMMARRNKASIHLLHVVPEIDASMRAYISAMMVKGSLDRFDAEHETEARAEIARRLKQFAADELADHPEDLERVTSVDVCHGDPVTNILLTADRLNVDVIVMGTHGKGAMEYTFLGSVAEKVLRKTRRPVFIIPIP
ncbi:universal stress protein [Desulfuromonas carbonis]|uniref:universal stress protein n=1 Tax=Desulfuromonas sp. DDH964 TaxID=1823759 RepID=UPI00078B7522|nr:universal stress protein [Desulfuromonas sp. DDH964]AMV71646.1 universal stress protein Usp [Desulfuromonas sp. DDH964]